MSFLAALIPSRLVAELIGIAIVCAALIAGVAWFSHHERQIGRDEVTAKWNAEKLALQAQVQQQQDRNLELQRQAEKRYTVQAEVRDRYITRTVTEVRDATVSLAACPVGADAMRLLNDASHCASEDRPAACGAGDPVQPSQ